MSDRGRSIPLTLPRRWVSDMLHFAHRVPASVVHRTVRLKPLADARREVPGAPGWHSLITKGLGVTSARVPDLRRAYLPCPWPRLYEAPYSVASVVFEKEFGGEPVPFFAPLLHPERLPLRAIQEKVRAWKADPVSAHGALRRLVRNARPPQIVRRALWGIGLDWNGLFRARTFGTFAVNTVRELGLGLSVFPCPLTSVWYYGGVTDAGEMGLHMAFDHRVFDGRAVARAYTELEAVLNEVIAAEVRSG
jgi:hypothetical protein